MPQPTTAVYFSESFPAAPAGNQLCLPQTDGAVPEQSVTFYPQLATTALNGVVKPDGTTITVDPDGTIHSVATGGLGGGGTSASGGAQVCVVPSGAKDGSNTQYTIPAPVLAGNDPLYFRNGIKQRQLGTKAEFSIQGTQLTVAPSPITQPLKPDDWHELHYVFGTPDSESSGGGGVTPVGNPLFLQGATNYVSGATTNAVAFTSANSAGSCLIVDVVLTELFGGFGTASISDSQGNSYSAIINQEQNATRAITWVALNCAGGVNTVTVIYSQAAAGGQPDINVAIHEYAGVATASALDTSAYAQNSTPGASALSVSVTTTVPGDLLHLFASALLGSVITFTESGGWNQRETSTPSGSGNIPGLETWDNLAVAAGSYSDTVATNTAFYLACYLIALKPFGS